MLIKLKLSDLKEEKIEELCKEFNFEKKQLEELYSNTEIPININNNEVLFEDKTFKIQLENNNIKLTKLKTYFTNKEKRNFEAINGKLEGKKAYNFPVEEKEKLLGMMKQREIKVKEKKLLGESLLIIPEKRSMKCSSIEDNSGNKAVWKDELGGWLFI